MKDIKKVWGVGITDKGKYVTRKDVGGMTPEYTRWTNMLQRCYSKEYHQRQRNYEDSTVCEEWLYFQNFAEWCNNQTNWGKPRYAVDKDLTKLGNSIYCPEYCYIIPPDVNSLLSWPKPRLLDKGELPVGVFINDWKSKKDKVMYEARCGDGNGHLKVLINSQDPWECFQAYKEFKTSVIYRVANKFREELSDTIYTNLVNFEVIPFPKRG